MKVLLVGCTGNLGTRCLQALLAHNHTVVLYVRNPAKLHKLVSPDVIQRIAAIVLGDATDAASLLAALQDHAVDAIVDVAGNQVLPWQEQVLPKITRSVTKAAVATGRARGRPLRAWFVTGINVLEYPGAPGLLTDYGGFVLRMAAVPHLGTRDVVEAVPLEDLRWSLICVAVMHPADPQQKTMDVLEAPRGHNLALKASVPPEWENTWLVHIPYFGLGLNLWWNVVLSYSTILEDVADFLADDLAIGSEEWVGLKVGMKDKRKMKTE